MKLSSIFICASLASSLGVGTTHAGGYDTPILYSAEHMGMGGLPSAMSTTPRQCSTIRPD